MTATAGPSGEAPRVAARAALATRGYFSIAGIGVATWAPMVPVAKARLGLDEAQLGAVLLCMGIGSVISMPLAGALCSRIGSRAAMSAAAALMCLLLPLLGIAPSTISLGAALVVFGAAMGVLDVSMNAQAVEVERLHLRPLMSGFHGAYSAGGIVGAGAMSGLMALGASPPMSAAAVAMGLLAAVPLLRGKLLPHLPPAPSAAASASSARAFFTRPSATVLLLGCLCLVAYVAEGAVLDWGALFLRDDRGMSVAISGLGYGAFSVAMTAGRLLGDRITAALGPPRVVRLGCALAAAGLWLGLALPWGAVSFAAFVLVGLGLSNAVPVLFSTAGRLPGPSVGMALATVTTLGYAGLLAGPAVIGLIASQTSLPLSLAGIGGLLFAVALGGPAVLARVRGAREA